MSFAFNERVILRPDEHGLGIEAVVMAGGERVLMHLNGGGLSVLMTFAPDAVDQFADLLARAGKAARS